MNIRDHRLSALTLRDHYRFSYPIKAERGRSLLARFPLVPQLIVNRSQELISGYDCHRFLTESGTQKAPVMILDISPVDALFLAFNLRSTHDTLNAYEMMVFIRRTIAYLTPAEIAKRSAVQLPLSGALIERLPLLTGPEFKEPLVKERLSITAALRLADMPPGDRASVLALLRSQAFTRSQQIQLIELVEEISFREKCPVSRLLQNSDIKARAPAPPAREIIARLFRRRFPALSQAQKEWRQRIRALELPSLMRVRHDPAFESDQIDINLTVRGIRELEELSRWLKNRQNPES